jgi:hypothetical protein
VCHNLAPVLALDYLAPVTKLPFNAVTLITGERKERLRTMRPHKRPRNLLANGILLAGLVGVLILNLVIVIDLPTRVYTAKQLAYLDYNRSRSISQAAPSWSIIRADGTTHPAIPSYIRENRVRASLYAHYEEQDGVSVTVYDLDFRGEYLLVYDGPASTIIELFFPFPDNLETLHQVRLLVDGEEPPEVQYTTSGINWQAELQPGEERQVHISYQADGANTFAYRLYRGQRSDVDVAITVVGLAGSTVPRVSLPTTSDEATDDGEILIWDYAGLIVDRDVQLTLPTRLSFAQRIAGLQEVFRLLAGLAPLLVTLFLVSLAAVFYLGRVRLGLESYLLVGCGMALFFPLLTFVSGLVDLVPAAAIALTLVSGLLLVFLSLAAGWQRIRWRAGLLLIVFLGFFSLGILTPWQGLMLTSGGLLLVGTLMLQYVRRPPAPEPEPSPPPTSAVSELEPALPHDEVTPEPESARVPDETIPESDPTLLAGVVSPSRADLYCPFCARALADDYRFCPGCGHDTEQFRRCGGCGVPQFVPAELDPAHCVHCGQDLA